MKFLLLTICLFFHLGDLPSLAELRSEYIKASTNKEVVEKLYDALSGVTVESEKTYVAYKGALSTLKAKYAKGKTEKKELFKEGAGLIDFAIKAAPNNMEIRVIRMSIQENAPKFLRYNKNISEDKEQVLKQYSAIQSKAAKDFVKAYVLQSEGFSAEEKATFK